MACATIHLAIAKKYLNKHEELNYEKVIAEIGRASCRERV